MARRAAADRSPRGGSARPPARGPLRALRGVRPSIAHALTFGEGVSHGDLATRLSADSAEPAPSVAGPERLTGAHRATRTLPVFPFGGSRADIRRDSAFQSAVPPRSFRLRVSGAVAPSAPAPGGTGLSRGDRPAVTAMIGAARPLSTARRGGRGRPVTPASSPPTLYCPQRHLGAWPRGTTPSIRRGRSGTSFNITSALAEGYPAPLLGLRAHRVPSTSPRHLAEGYDIARDGADGGRPPSTSPRCWAEGYLPKPAHVLASVLPSTSPRRLAEGYPPRNEPLGETRRPSTSPRHLAEGYIDQHGARDVVLTPSTSPRRLAEGYPSHTARTIGTWQPFNVTSALGRGILALGVRCGRDDAGASTSPRRWAEGYVPLERKAGHLRSASTSPRRWAEGYLPEPRTNVSRVIASTSPRRWAEGYAATNCGSRRRRGGFNVTSALGRGIPARSVSSCRLPPRFNVTSALGRGILGADTNERPLRLASTSPRRLAEGYVSSSNRSPASTPSASTSPRRLAEGYTADYVDAEGEVQASTSPRRLAEGYMPRGLRGRRPGVASTSPRRLAEGYPFLTVFPHHSCRSFNVTSALGRGIQAAATVGAAREQALQRHLGAWPRDTLPNCGRCPPRPLASTSPRRLAEGYGGLAGR